MNKLVAIVGMSGTGKSVFRRTKLEKIIFWWNNI